MVKTERIDLHGIDRAIDAVQKKLKGVRRGATEEEQKHIDATIRRLEGVRTTTATICPKVWSVWPAASAGAKAKAGVARGGRKTGATKARSKK